MNNPNIDNSIMNNFDNSDVVLRRSEKPMKEKKIGNDFYTYLVDNGPLTYSEAVFSSNVSFWKEAIKIELDSILQNQT